MLYLLANSPMQGGTILLIVETFLLRQLIQMLFLNSVLCSGFGCSLLPGQNQACFDVRGEVDGA